MRRTLVLIGSLLIALAVASWFVEGITYTTREDVVTVGPIEATAQTRETFPIPRAFSYVALAGGIILVLVGIIKTHHSHD